LRGKFDFNQEIQALIRNPVFGSDLALSSKNIGSAQNVGFNWEAYETAVIYLFLSMEYSYIQPPHEGGAELKHP